LPGVKHYWAVVSRHPRPLRFLTARLLMATGACRLLTIQQCGHRVRFHPANLASQLWIDPGCRDEALSFFHDYLKPGDVVVDVGANIGDTVLTAAARVGSSGRVIAIEPHPRTFAFLRENVALNHADNVQLLNVAVGAAPGTARFSDDRRDDMNRIGDGGLEVAVETLDHLVSSDKPIALMKVDVEGYEKFVFEGAPSVLRRTACAYFEVSALHVKRYGYATRDLLSLLRSGGFAVFRHAGRRRFAPVTATFDTAGFENLLALRDADDFARRTGWQLVPFEP
jgi:FkbM family methyltransferase